MKTIAFLIVISLLSVGKEYNSYMCKTDEGLKGVVYSKGEYKRGDTIWLNNSNFK
jgi:hypothetical protein